MRSQKYGRHRFVDEREPQGVFKVSLRCLQGMFKVCLRYRAFISVQDPSTKLSWPPFCAKPVSKSSAKQRRKAKGKCYMQTAGSSSPSKKGFRPSLVASPTLPGPLLPRPPGPPLAAYPPGPLSPNRIRNITNPLEPRIKINVRSQRH